MEGTEGTERASTQRLGGTEGLGVGRDPLTDCEPMPPQRGGRSIESPELQATGECGVACKSGDSIDRTARPRPGRHRLLPKVPNACHSPCLCVSALKLVPCSPSPRSREPQLVESFPATADAIDSAISACTANENSGRS